MAKRSWRCSLIALIFLPAIASADLLSPLDQLKNQFNNYQDKTNLLVVFDIDDTILSNELLINADQGYDISRVVGYQRLSKLPLIPEVKVLYDWCVSHDVNVAFITFRCASERLPTIKNLKQQNINEWEELILFPEPCDYHSITAKAYKTNERRKLTQAGYTIMAAIGDQYSDIHGGYADLSIKLDDAGYYTK